MVGAINYLRTIKAICREHMGDCKSCPLGDKPHLSECMCPRLTEPWKWTDNKTTAMVRAVSYLKGRRKSSVGSQGSEDRTGSDEYEKQKA